MPEDANSSQVFNFNTEFVNSNCTAFFTSLQRTSALSFTEPSPHPSPSPSVDLCSICALVQIFYCFLCTSQNSLSLAEHNCAPVKVSSHWLLRLPCTSRELLSDVSWRRYFLRRVSLFVERKIVHRLISVPCTESLPRLPILKSFGLLKASGSQIYCSSFPRRKKPLESSESFDKNGSWNTLGLFIPSTWMARYVCLVSVSEWSVAEMVAN